MCPSDRLPTCCVLWSVDNNKESYISSSSSFRVNHPESSDQNGLSRIGRKRDVFVLGLGQSEQSRMDLPRLLFILAVQRDQNRPVQPEQRRRFSRRIPVIWVENPRRATETPNQVEQGRERILPIEYIAGFARRFWRISVLDRRPQRPGKHHSSQSTRYVRMHACTIHAHSFTLVLVHEYVGLPQKACKFICHFRLTHLSLFFLSLSLFLSLLQAATIEGKEAGKRRNTGAGKIYDSISFSLFYSLFSRNTHSYARGSSYYEPGHGEFPVIMNF